MRTRVIRCGIVAMFVVHVAGSQAQTVTISAVQTFQPATWAGVPPGEGQSTVVRYARPDKSIAGRILISNDWLPFGQVFVPTGTVAYQDIGGPIQSSTFEVPANCAVPFSNSNRTCDWNYVSNDHDLISTSEGTVYYMPGVGYKGPSAASQPPTWFLGGKLWNTYATYRSNFGPNARSALAVWKSTDHGQTFQWLTYFDPTAYFDGSCAYPQYRSNPTAGDTGVVGSPWDMGGSDGQSVWSDPVTGKIFLTFQCVGYQPSQIAPWTLGLNQAQTNGIPQVNPDNSAVYVPGSTAVNESILASLNEKTGTWVVLAFPKEKGWRIGAVPYNQYLLLGFGGQVMIADTTQAYAPLWAAYPAAAAAPAIINIPQVTTDWTGFVTPPFMWVAVPYPNVLTRWGSRGYGFAYATNNAAPGGARIFGYTLYYFTLPSASGVVLPNVNTAAPNPQWGEVPSQINPTKTGGFVTDPTAIDVGSGTTLLYWYDVDVDPPTGQQPNVTIRGRLLMEGGVTSNDFAITPVPFSVAGGQVHFWGDYKTAGGYCSINGASTTSVYYPMWVDVGSGTAQYAEVSTTVPWVGDTPAGLGLGCQQPAATNQLGAATGSMDRLSPRKLPLQLTHLQRVIPGRLMNASTVKVEVPRPDVSEHRSRPVEAPRESTPKLP